MVNTRDATRVLDHDFLETRCKILEIAAMLDRIDRAGAAWRAPRPTLEPVAPGGRGAPGAGSRPGRDGAAHFFARI